MKEKAGQGWKKVRHFVGKEGTNKSRSAVGQGREKEKDFDHEIHRLVKS